MSNEIYDVVVEPKLKESKKILTFTVLYKVVANIIYKIINLGTVIRFIKNKDIMKNSTLP
ncbi:hypothetical protein ASJ81_13450 [Methanosarcina spelaei]|uniref:Uncharacterized protein n=1 Tax=Methanosarcina spelaei TaxID=1036679 RepID=A0A2A2HMB3_9EURY|nr:hypothetical protein ASJ81_13450 [Methanosarcina spelaei]